MKKRFERFAGVVAASSMVIATFIIGVVGYGAVRGIGAFGRWLIVTGIARSSAHAGILILLGAMILGIISMFAIPLIITTWADLRDYIADQWEDAENKEKIENDQPRTN